MQQFNPIQSKWVVAMQMRSVLLLQQSIPFHIAALYIMVQNFQFSFIYFIAVIQGKHHLWHTKFI